MGNQRENNDELLFGLLSEKLYSHYCGDEEEHLSKEEELAVINMMNSLQVDEQDDFNPTSSYKKFCDKYLTEEEAVAKTMSVSSIEELLAEMENDLKEMKEPMEKLPILSEIGAILGRLGRMRVVRRLALAVLIMAVMFCGMNIGTYATAKMGFVEFLSKNDNGWSFMVTGETVDLDDINKTTFNSWEEVKQEEGMEDMLLPQWIPDGCELKNIGLIKGPDKRSFDGKYYMGNEEKFQIVIEKYTEEIRWQFFTKTIGDDYVEEKVGDKDILWYEDGEKTVCFFVKNQRSYYVCGDVEKDLIKIIVENIK